MLMPNDIRAFVPGGTFFFTVNRLERRRRLLTDDIDDLRSVFIDAHRRRPFTIDASTPFHLILRSQRGEKWPDVRSLSDLRLFYCGIEETGQLSRSIALNRPNYSPRSSEKSASVPQSLATNAQAGQAPRRASAGIASSISSSRNTAAGCFSPRPEGAPQTRPGGVTALGNDPIPCARCLAWARLEGL